MIAHQLTPKIPQAPQVNVIKSNTQIVNSSRTHTNSAGATDGDTTKRTNMMNMQYVLDSNRPLDTPIEFMVSGSPIVHQALGGRKLHSKGIKYDSTITSRNASFLGSQFSASGNHHQQLSNFNSNNKQQNREMRNNANKTATSTKKTDGGYEMSSHVGLLQVPDSLKA